MQAEGLLISLPAAWVWNAEMRVASPNTLCLRVEECASAYIIKRRPGHRQAPDGSTAGEAAPAAESVPASLKEACMGRHDIQTGCISRHNAGGPAQPATRESKEHLHVRETTVMPLRVISGNYCQSEPTTGHWMCESLTLGTALLGTREF